MDSAEIIRSCRERAGLTRRQLAEKIGVSRDHIWRWECGGVNPRTDYLIAVCRATGFELIVQEKYSAGYLKKGRRNS